MKTIQMTIDEPMLKVVDKLIRMRKTTRSAFIRSVLQAEIGREKVPEQEAQHAAGYARKPVKAGEFDIWDKEQDWGAP
jgi:metal-responsive CopG/Arc/MetJ family transcriptional regulator